ncbi:hypothetical protein KVV02_005001, partial [Mortierella alpina]
MSYTLLNTLPVTSPFTSTIMLLKLSTVAALVLVAASSAAAQFAPCHSEALLAPLLASDNAEVIPDSYFVVFKNGIRAQDNSGWVQDLHQRDVSVNGLSDLDSGVRHVFDMGSFQGLAGRFSPEVLDEIRRNPD